MSDQRPLRLDLDTERLLVDCLHHDMSCGRFHMSHDQLFVLDANSGDPKKSELIGRLKEKFGFIDFDAGGVKLLEVEMRGSTARFTVVPRWEMPPPGVKGFGGPSIGLRFTLTW